MPSASQCHCCPKGCVASEDGTHCVSICNPRKDGCRACTPGQELIAPRFAGHVPHELQVRSLRQHLALSVVITLSVYFLTRSAIGAFVATKRHGLLRGSSVRSARTRLQLRTVSQSESPGIASRRKYGTARESKCWSWNLVEGIDHFSAF